MNLYLDDDALKKAQADLKQQSDDMRTLKQSIIDNLEVLKADWDSEAGVKFFARFETDLLDSLEDYALVFDYMSQNLETASTQYKAVFSAADAVANTEI